MAFQELHTCIKAVLLSYASSLPCEVEQTGIQRTLPSEFMSRCHCLPHHSEVHKQAIFTDQSCLTHHKLREGQIVAKPIAVSYLHGIDLCQPSIGAFCRRPQHGSIDRPLELIEKLLVTDVKLLYTCTSIKVHMYMQLIEHSSTNLVYTCIAVGCNASQDQEEYVHTYMYLPAYSHSTCTYATCMYVVAPTISNQNGCIIPFTLHVQVYCMKLDSGHTCMDIMYM